MKVSLVSVTEPALLELPAATAEDLIVYAARVSSPQNQENIETAPKLLRYLIKNGHWSPFEMVDMTVEIETSRAIAAQILRHRSFSFQEFSQRYAEADLGFERTYPRRQDPKNRQSSIDDMDEYDFLFFETAQKEVEKTARSFYDQALKMGIAKECARFLLPLSTTTRLYMKGSVRSFIHYLQARTHPSTQKEHRDVAEAVKVIFKQHFPNVAAALEET